MPEKLVVASEDLEEFERELQTAQDQLPKRIDANPEKVEQGLAKLVLTLVELIRRLLEMQALRRMEHNTLSAEEIERIGDTFIKLEEKMAELREVFGLTTEDLNNRFGTLRQPDVEEWYICPYSMQHNHPAWLMCWSGC